MKMRLRPLRGQFYPSERGEIQFIEKINGLHGICKVVRNGSLYQMGIQEIILPIIDTKDYEKIEDKKYKGD